LDDPSQPAAGPWVVGESVPWSVAWTGEQAFVLRPDLDFPGHLELVQTSALGEGRPIFAFNHMTRNRRGQIEYLCHVCGAPTLTTDRWLFPVHSGGWVPLGDGRRRYGGNVPPVHKGCAERAARLCPHLSRQMAVPVRFPADDEGRMVWRTDVTPDMAEIARMLPPGAPVVLSCYRLHGAKFSKLVERLRRRAGVE